jgi:hypothetical protein
MTTIKLDYPVTVDGRVIKTLDMRRPTVGDRLTAFSDTKGDDDAKEVVLYTLLTGESTEVIHALDLTDYAKVQKVFFDFLKK